MKIKNNTTKKLKLTFVSFGASTNNIDEGIAILDISRELITEFPVDVLEIKEEQEKELK